MRGSRRTAIVTIAVITACFSAASPAAGQEEPIDPATLVGTLPFDPLRPAEVDEHPDISNPDPDRLPLFQGYLEPPSGNFNTLSSASPPRYAGIVAAGDNVVVRDGNGAGLHWYSGDTRARLASVPSGPYGPWLAGPAFYKGEVFAYRREKRSATEDRGLIVVFDATGRRLREMQVPPLLLRDHTTTLSADELGRPPRYTQIQVAWGEVWASEGSCGTPERFDIFDRRTGIYKGSTLLNGTQSYPLWCLHDVAEQPDPASPVDPSFDFALAPPSTVITSYLAFEREDLVPMASTEWTSDTAYSAPLGSPQPHDVHLRAFDWVRGMNYLLYTTHVTYNGQDFPLGHDITEYTLAHPASPPDVERKWEPQQPGTITDISYHYRGLRIDARGNLTDSQWQHRSQCLTYNVSDADIYLVGRRGEHYYELARNFSRIELLVDEVVRTSSTLPNGQLCIDLDQLASGEHVLKLRAYADGERIENVYSPLRVDKTPPSGQLSGHGAFTRGSVTLSDTWADGHSGRQDWKLEVRRTGGTFSALCGVQSPADPHTCPWNTTDGRFPDGAYELRPVRRDAVAADRGGANVSSPVHTTTVDNTPPQLVLSDMLWDARDYRPLLGSNEYPLVVGVNDPTSGPERVEVLVDGISQPVGAASCGAQLCRGHVFQAANHVDGEHTVIVRGFDRAGNVAETSWKVDVEQQPPEVDSGTSRLELAPTLTPAELAQLPDPTEVLPCTAEGDAPNFPVWTVGPTFETLQRIAVERRCDEPSALEPIRFNAVTHVYGGCTPEAGEDQTCSAPLEIQSWPACERNLSSYDIGPAEFRLNPAEIQVRGVPAAKFEEGLRVEVYTGVSTVVIFGHDAAQVLRAANAMRQETLGPAPPLPLEPPTEGALTGTLSCAAQLALNEIERKKNDALGLL